MDNRLFDIDMSGLASAIKEGKDTLVNDITQSFKKKDKTFAEFKEIIRKQLAESMGSVELRESLAKTDVEIKNISEEVNNIIDSINDYTENYGEGGMMSEMDDFGDDDPFSGMDDFDSVEYESSSSGEDSDNDTSISSVDADKLSLAASSAKLNTILANNSSALLAGQHTQTTIQKSILTGITELVEINKKMYDKTFPTAKTASKGKFANDPMAIILDETVTPLLESVGGFLNNVNGIVSQIAMEGITGPLMNFGVSLGLDFAKNKFRKTGGDLITTGAKRLIGNRKRKGGIGVYSALGLSDVFSSKIEKMSSKLFGSYGDDPLSDMIYDIARKISPSHRMGYTSKSINPSEKSSWTHGDGMALRVQIPKILTDIHAEIATIRASKGIDVPKVAKNVFDAKTGQYKDIKHITDPLRKAYVDISNRQRNGWINAREARNARLEFFKNQDNIDALKSFEYATGISLNNKSGAQIVSILGNAHKHVSSNSINPISPFGGGSNFPTNINNSGGPKIPPINPLPNIGGLSMPISASWNGNPNISVPGGWNGSPGSSGVNINGQPNPGVVGESSNLEEIVKSVINKEKKKSETGSTNNTPVGATESPIETMIKEAVNKTSSPQSAEENKQNKESKVDFISNFIKNNMPGSKKSKEAPGISGVDVGDILNKADVPKDFKTRTDGVIDDPIPKPDLKNIKVGLSHNIPHGPINNKSDSDLDSKQHKNIMDRNKVYAENIRAGINNGDILSVAFNTAKLIGFNLFNAGKQFAKVMWGNIKSVNQISTESLSKLKASMVMVGEHALSALGSMGFGALKSIGKHAAGTLFDTLETTKNVLGRNGGSALKNLALVGGLPMFAANSAVSGMTGFSGAETVGGVISHISGGKGRPDKSKPPIPKTIGEATNGLIEGFAKLNVQVVAMTDTMKDLFNLGFDKTLSLARSGFGKLFKMSAGALGGIVGSKTVTFLLEGMVQPIVGATSSILGGLANGITRMGAHTLGGLGTMVSGVSSGVGAILGNIADVVSSVAKSNSMTGKVFGFISNILGHITEGVKNMAHNVVGGSGKYLGKTLSAGLTTIGLGIRAPLAAIGSLGMLGDIRKSKKEITDHIYNQQKEEILNRIKEQNPKISKGELHNEFNKTYHKDVLKSAREHTNLAWKGEHSNGDLNEYANQLKGGVRRKGLNRFGITNTVDSFKYTEGGFKDKLIAAGKSFIDNDTSSNVLSKGRSMISKGISGIGEIFAKNKQEAEAEWGEKTGRYIKKAAKSDVGHRIASLEIGQRQVGLLTQILHALSGRRIDYSDGISNTMTQINPEATKTATKHNEQEARDEAEVNKLNADGRDGDVSDSNKKRSNKLSARILERLGNVGARFNTMVSRDGGDSKLKGLGSLLGKGLKGAAGIGGLGALAGLIPGLGGAGGGVLSSLIPGLGGGSATTTAAAAASGVAGVGFFGKIKQMGSWALRKGTALVKDIGSAIGAGVKAISSPFRLIWNIIKTSFIPQVTKFFNPAEAGVAKIVAKGGKEALEKAVVVGAEKVGIKKIISLLFGKVLKSMLIIAGTMILGTATAGAATVIGGAALTAFNTYSFLEIVNLVIDGINLVYHTTIMRIPFVGDSPDEGNGETSVKIPSSVSSVSEGKLSDPVDMVPKPITPISHGNSFSSSIPSSNIKNMGGMSEDIHGIPDVHVGGGVSTISNSKSISIPSTKPKLVKKSSNSGSTVKHQATTTSSSGIKEILSDIPSTVLKGSPGGTVVTNSSIQNVGNFKHLYNPNKHYVISMSLNVYEIIEGFDKIEKHTKKGTKHKFIDTDKPIPVKLKHVDTDDIKHATLDKYSVSSSTASKEAIGYMLHPKPNSNTRMLLTNVVLRFNQAAPGSASKADEHKDNVSVGDDTIVNSRSSSGSESGTSSGSSMGSSRSSGNVSSNSGANSNNLSGSTASSISTIAQASTQTNSILSDVNVSTNAAKEHISALREHMSSSSSRSEEHNEKILSTLKAIEHHLGNVSVGVDATNSKLKQIHRATEDNYDKERGI